MIKKFASAILPIFCCLWLVPAVDGQTAPPVVFTTSSTIIKSQLKLPDGRKFLVTGAATLTITKANDDDTVAGTLVYTLSDAERKSLAEITGRPVAEIPGSFDIKDLTASFRRGASCPLIKLQVAIKELDLPGAKLIFERATLNIYESPDSLNQLFCSWTRQINAKRQRIGIIAAINRLIAPEKDEVENKAVKP